ncbi:class I SAM-dependent methyltransferase [Streptomyces sp. PTD5-9]|uniref:class I SAM-dependent methyltransferase n=1 Tax=Streptomyces sp. PTD5-9 TaxID=3120150 RepID=UPI003009D5AA
MTEPDPTAVARFYDELAADYHLVYADWDAGMARQGEALDKLIRAKPGHGGPARVLDCSCGIGTQAIALALRGHRVTGTDISRSAAARAAREAAARGVRLSAATADMRRLPFADARFDTVVCADNSLPHLLTEADVHAALAEMRRVLRPGGLLVVSTRPYDEILRARPTSTAPQTSSAPTGRTVTFQLWNWHDDGERYDLEHFQLLPIGGGSGGEPASGLGDKNEHGNENGRGDDHEGHDGWRVRVRRSTYWALTRRQLTDLATGAGFDAPKWHTPDSTGFFQPILTARAP